MKKEYDIEKVIELRDSQNLKWKEIEEIIGVSGETLRKAYKRKKEGLSCTEANPNNYPKQKQRGLLRKIQLINEFGGKCQECGYNKNIAALEFHHINPDEKEFQLDMRHLSNTSIEKLRAEAAKCKLLCANCHRELHNPEFYFDNLNSLLETYKDMEDKPLDKSTKSIAICPICGKEFKTYERKIYCSDECKYKSKNYPSIEEVNEQYEILHSWEKVANHFNLTRRIIQGIRNRIS